MKKLTTEEFIKKSKIIHNNKYNYSNVNYNGIYKKVDIICPVHGIFNQSPKHHLNGKGCGLCVRNIKYTTESYIKRAKEIHGDDFNYSKTIYIKSHHPIIIICNIHGDIKIDPSKHIRGLGCSKCNNHKEYTNIRKKYNFNFIQKAKEVHNDKYDYSLVEYINAKTKIKIICKKHGVFEQSPSNHIQGYGCSLCGNSLRLTKNIFIQKAKEIHGDKYDYSLVEYINTKTKIKIICKKHGVFEQTPNKHLQNRGCSTCNSSKGELFIKDLLDKNKIKYECQKFFKDCKYLDLLKFDFYLIDYNICIEYDGEQHYEISSFFGGKEEFINIQKRDNIKNEYCRNNNIHLIRIKYNDNILERLNFLTKLKITSYGSSSVMTN